MKFEILIFVKESEQKKEREEHSPKPPKSRKPLCQEKKEILERVKK